MRLIGGLAAALAAIVLAGCPNPNDIGVQTYGTVAVRTVDTSGAPVSGVLVSAGSTYTCRTDSTGNCTTVLRLPVGKWTLSANVVGLTGTADVSVTANTQSNVTIQMAP